MQLLSVDQFRGNLLQVDAGPSLWFGTDRLARRVRFADSGPKRLRGLMFRPAMIDGEALLLEPAHQIHTFGMRFPIDAVFVDHDWKVVHLIRALQPNRLTRWVRDSRRVAELASGTIPAHMNVGDLVELR